MCSSLARNSCRTTFMFRKLPRCNTHCPCAELAIGFEPRNNVPNSRTEQDYDGAAPLAHKLLSDRSFHIEFGGFLTNHVKHAVVALEGLGASAELIQRYWDWCELRHLEICVHRPAQKDNTARLLVCINTLELHPTKWS
jgi:hypothetical protein